MLGVLPCPAALQVVLSHTPFRQLTAQYADLPVLVAGRGQVGRGWNEWDAAPLAPASEGAGSGGGRAPSPLTHASPALPRLCPWAQVREVARHYGLKHVVTTRQLAAAMPAAVPFQ